MMLCLAGSACAGGDAKVTGASPVAAVPTAASESATKPCAGPDISALRTAWKSFRAASLKGTPEQVAKFYKFPVKILSPFDGVKPHKLSKSLFIENFLPIFREDVVDKRESSLYKELRKTTDNENISVTSFHADKCAFMAAVRINDYEFVLDKNRGWLVESFYANADFDVIGEFTK